MCEDIGRSLLTYGRRIPLTEWESRIAVTRAPGKGSGVLTRRLLEGRELRPGSAGCSCRHPWCPRQRHPQAGVVGRGGVGRGEEGRQRHWGGRAPLLPSPLRRASSWCKGKMLVDWVMTGQSGPRVPVSQRALRFVLQEVDAQAVREVCSKYFYDQCPAVAALGE